MKRTTLAHLRQYKGHQKFTCVTAYDATFAHWASESEVEMILVGDSLGMVLQGRDSTLPVTLQDMCYHTQAVARGNQNCLIMSDVPFMQAASVERALQAAEALMQAGAEIIKIEGDERLAPVVSALNAAGVPVCVHLGLTPQFVHRFGGYKVQGRDEASRTRHCAPSKPFRRLALTYCYWSACPVIWRHKSQAVRHCLLLALARAPRPMLRSWSCMTCWASTPIDSRASYVFSLNLAILLPTVSLALTKPC